MNLKLSKHLCVFFACTNMMFLMVLQSPLNGVIGLLMILSAFFLDYYDEG